MCPAEIEVGVMGLALQAPKVESSPWPRDPALSPRDGHDRGCNLLSDNGLIAVTQGCVGLRHMGLGNCVRFTDAAIGSLALHAGECLKYIDISGCQKVRKTRGLSAMSRW